MADLAISFQGTPIRRAEERVNLTDMWRAAGGDPDKRPVDWLRLPGTAQFLEYLAENLKVGKSHLEKPAETGGLLLTERGGRDPGTWAHWQVGMAYAKYLSPEFHAWCNEVVRAHMSGGAAPGAGELSSLISDLVRSMHEDHAQRSAWASRVEQQQSGLQREVRDGMAALSRGLHATDAKIKGVIEEQAKTSKEVGRLAGDIASLKNVEKREFRDRDKRRMRRVVLNAYGGMCPCCGDAKILESMHGQVFGQYDHWYSRRRIEIHEGWLVCLDCNQNRLGEAGNESRRPSYRYRFDSFHEHRAKIEGEGRQLSIIEGGKAGDGAA